MDSHEMRVIARIRTDFPTKFGIPRQSGLIASLRGEIVFEKEFRDPNALRGIEGYSHLWLLWCFSEAMGREWSPTVRPPRLGGNKRMGVFATRSPFRPNPIGLSSVKLEGIEERPGLGTVLIVSGADLMDGTPIYDIKPYLAFTDSHPDALGGFADTVFADRLEVEFPEDLLKRLPADKREAAVELLAQNPRPTYQNDPDYVYGAPFAGHELHFRIEGDRLIVTAVD